MKYIEINSRPTVLFSHEYSANTYSNKFDQKQGQIEVAYIVSGSSSFTCCNKTVELSKGDVFINLFNSTMSAFSAKPHTHRTVGIRVDWFESQSGIMIPEYIKEKDGDAIRQLIDRAVLEKSSYSGSPTREGELILRILCEIDRASKKTFQSGEEIYASKAKDYISKHLERPITQKEIASMLGITPGYLCTVFKKTQGITLMQYINKQKMTAMRGVMQKERLKLYEAAALYGYSDPNYVSRLYKKLFSKNITNKNQ